MDEKSTTRWSRLLHCAQSGLTRFAPVSVAALVLFLCNNLSPFLDSSNGFAFLDAGCFGAIWAMPASVTAQLFCERYKITRRNPFPWLVAVVAGLIGWWLRYSHDINPIVFFWRSLLHFGIPLVCAALAVWLLYDTENQDSLFATLTKNTLFSGAVTGIVLVGLILCYFAVSTLLFPLNSVWFTIAITFPVNILFPILFCALLPACGESTKLPRVLQLLAGRTALPVYLFLIAILYGYIGKILFTWKMPSGTMNWFASLALAGYLFFWLTLRQDAAPWVQKFLRWGWAGLLPILAVQMVGIVIRLHAYGLTTARYAGLLCLAVGIVGLLLAAVDWHPKHLFLIFAVVVFAGICTPLNIVDMPRFCQTHRIESILREHDLWDGTTLRLTSADLSESEQIILRDSLNYLYANRSPAQWQSNLTKQILAHPYNDWNEVAHISDTPAIVHREWSLRSTVSVPVQGYDLLYPVHWYCDDTVGWTFHEKWEDGTSIEWDSTDYLKEVTQNCENQDTLPEAYRMVKLSDTQTLYFNELYLHQNGNAANVSGRLDGYLLVKQTANN